MQPKMQDCLTLTVPENTGKQRLDAFCASTLHNMTRSKFKAGIQSVQLNGKPAKLSASVQSGDVINVVWNNPVPETLIPERIPLSVLFENEDVLVVNKPAGMVTHPAAGNWTGTLVQALAYYRLHTSSIRDELSRRIAGETEPNSFTRLLRAGIVHRLDKDTSGVLITARNAAAESFLKEAFKQRRTEKYYLALLQGIPEQPSGIIETSIFRDGRTRIRFAASADLSKGKYARSRYKVLNIYGNCALVLFKIDTGRTHQIRLHARFIGCPVVGDSLYGKKNAALKQYGLMLHAYRLRLRLPAQQEPSTFTAPVPQRFLSAIAVLRNARNTHSI